MAQEAKEAIIHTGSIEFLRERLASCRALIAYEPLRTEVDFRTIFPSLPHDLYIVPKRASEDPTQHALHALSHAKGERAVVFLPGRRFDAFGTRHGQGGGWYDRFLARVPSSWIRVGFCFEDQFSEARLERHDWDEPVDCIIVANRETGSVRVVPSARLEP